MHKWENQDLNPESDSRTYSLESIITKLKLPDGGLSDNSKARIGLLILAPRKPWDSFWDPCLQNDEEKAGLHRKRNWTTMKFQQRSLPLEISGSKVMDHLPGGDGPLFYTPILISRWIEAVLGEDMTLEEIPESCLLQLPCNWKISSPLPKGDLKEHHGIHARVIPRWPQLKD